MASEQERAADCEEPSQCATDASATPDGAARPGGESFCGVAAAVTVLGDAWTLLIVRDLANGARRFGELQTSTGVSARVLTDRLRAMRDAGLITRKMYAEIPPRVEYTLTEKGRDAVSVVDALRAFGEKWLRASSHERLS
ncbi:MAG TPA: helix-turn-helix domain-containing protein [Ktedonobacterales bacterium]|nr:helix-turn-helix domain-containing protein [Ktedonobacterales bacterium]